MRRKKVGEVSKRKSFPATFRREGKRRFERAGVAQVSAGGDVAKQNGTENVDQVQLGVRYVGKFVTAGMPPQAR